MTNKIWPSLTAMVFAVTATAACSNAGGVGGVQPEAATGLPTSTEIAGDAGENSGRPSPAETSTSALRITPERGENDETGADSGTNATSAPADTSLADDLANKPLPQSPEELAGALTQVERAVRSAGYSTQQLAVIGQHQQRLYRHLSFHPEWTEPALEAVGPDVAAAVALNWDARLNLLALLNTHSVQDAMPAWRIVAPYPAVDLLAYYKEAETLTDIDWEFVAAINLVETRMGRIQGISTAGAIGPMQFLPSTWAECCEGDPANPRDAIIGAATYLTHRGGPENMDKAIWGYNNSDHYVNAVTAYADVLRSDEQAYYAYHAWQVYFLTTAGVILIEEGYEQEAEIPVAEWLAQHPETLVSPST